MMKILKNIRFLLLFLLPFTLISYYILFVQTELYESSSTVLIKDLKPSSTPTDMLTALMPTSSSNIQDSKLIEKFIYSTEMFRKVDKKFSLKEHYMSNKLDFLQRMYSFSSSEDFLKLYKKRLVISYDELSNTLDIACLHTDPKRAKEMLQYIIVEAEKKLNMYDKENGNELLDFIKNQEKQNKKVLLHSIETLLAYQNDHKTIDPSIDIRAKSTILAEMEKKVVQKDIEYANLKQYMNTNSIELKTLSAEIKSLKKKREEIRSELSGVSKNELNEDLFEFETLKSDVEFNKERYKQTLIQLDMAMIQATQNAKNFIVITKPTLAEDYSSPDKVKNIITLFMVLFMIYGIISMIYSIIKDHRD
ncbi:Capsular polysaccharide export system inner membrane protein KpsE [hydrothermal vent metagenome]|uniref:Capsular polysaccharide export system inner membrane protein KpsE n=1 Tax=hydrothermal vent metagenome TaxID=652676 RepID=A0A1W1BYB3_9ZZZZ